MNQNRELLFIEKMLRGLLKEEATSPSELLCAMHNVMCHGSGFTNMGMVLSQDDETNVGLIVDSLETAMKAAREIEG